MLYIHHATLLSATRQIAGGAVLIDHGQIVAAGPVEQIACPSEARSFDAAGLTITPGWIDIQINGGFGHDFTAAPHTIWPVAAQLPRYGVTAFLPTVITSPLETVQAAQQVVLSRTAEFAGAKPLGLHVEGPFLNPQKKGAHNAHYLRSPSLEAIADWSPQQGVRLVTLAPELPNALDLVHALVKRGVAVSAGHSMSTFEQAHAGFDAGIRYGTHLFNAMPPLHHRDPGLAGALLVDSRPAAGLIADGIHTHPAMVDMIWRLLGPSRLSLVTDAMAAMGMSAGVYELGEMRVIVDQTSARLADGTLAGSILTLDAAIRNLIAMTGCSLAQAVSTVTAVPARLLGLQADLTPGAPADLTLLTADLHVAHTIIDGQIVYPQPLP